MLHTLQSFAIVIRCCLSVVYLSVCVSDKFENKIQRCSDGSRAQPMLGWLRTWPNCSYCLLHTPTHDVTLLPDSQNQSQFWKSLL